MSNSIALCAKIGADAQVCRNETSRTMKTKNILRSLDCLGPVKNCRKLVLIVNNNFIGVSVSYSTVKNACLETLLEICNTCGDKADDDLLECAGHNDDAPRLPGRFQ